MPMYLTLATQKCEISFRESTGFGLRKFPCLTLGTTLGIRAKFNPFGDLNSFTLHAISSHEYGGAGPATRIASGRLVTLTLSVFARQPGPPMDGLVHARASHRGRTGSGTPGSWNLQVREEVCYRQGCSPMESCPLISGYVMELIQLNAFIFATKSIGATFAGSRCRRGWSGDACSRLGCAI